MSDFLPKVLVVLGCTLFVSASATLAQGEDSQTVNGHLPQILPSLRASGNLPPETQLDLAIGLPLRNREMLSDLLRQMYDRTSTNFHRYLTPVEFTERFGPSQKDYTALIAFANRNGLRITGTHSNRMLLDVRASVATIEKAFHVSVRSYPHPTEARTFYTVDTEPTLDLSVPVLDISGLNDFALPRPLIASKQIIVPSQISAAVAPELGSGPSGTFMGGDFRAAYTPDTSLTGSGQVVGLLQFDGYSTSDIAYYKAKAGLPDVPVENVLLDGFSGAPTGGGGEVEEGMI